MEPYDYIRIFTILLFGVGSGFMVLTNFIAYRVLRPPQRLSFLWWHVMSISLSWLLIGGSAAYVVFTRLGHPPGVITAFVTPGMVLFAAAQVIIFSVERSRLVAKRSMDQALEHSNQAV